MSVGSHPAIPSQKAARSAASFVQVVFQSLRVAARKSVWVRVVLVSLLAMVVTTAGVVAGALVVAPIVAQVNAPSVGTTRSARLATVAASALTTARDAWRSLENIADEQLATLPGPLARYLLPSIAILSIVGALLALLLPSRRAPGVAIARTPTTNSARLAPKKHRTPKAVEALAASGASTADIAWKTGLPIDAVKLLLAISSGPRQVHPDTA